MIVFQDKAPAMDPVMDVVLIEGQASLTAVPAQAHIGEPVVWTLSVQHAGGDGLPEDLKNPLPVDEGWVLLEGPELRRTSLADGSVSSDVQWTYLSLRPGTHTPEPYALTLKRGAPLQVELVSLEVLGELEEGEEAPRPMAPIRPIEAGPSGHGSVWLGAGLLAILLLVILVRFRRRGPAQDTEEAPTVWKGLQAIQVSVDEPTARQALFDWHRDLRHGVDSILGQDRAALADADWLQQAQASPGAGALPWSDLKGLVEELEPLKYQEPLPGRLTLEALAARVGELARTIEGGQQSSTTGEPT